MRLALIGAGGHAKAVVEALRAADLPPDVYVDPRPCDWLEGIERIPSDDGLDASRAEGVVLGLGAVEPESLRVRLRLYRAYRARGLDAPTVRHPAATVSADARLAEGCILLAGSVVQPGAGLGEAVIVNSGAIVEHDCRVADGAHVAPGAILLGGASVGGCAMIGAGSVVLPGAKVPDGALVPALGRYPK